jgi:hypothetical protein
MKKITICLFLIFAFTSFGQTINGIPLKDLDVEYLQILGTSKMLSTKLTITIDIGQRTKLLSANTDAILLKDEKGEGIIFNSMIDALNFMSANGYEFVASNIITIGSQNVYHYLLRKRI